MGAGTGKLTGSLLESGLAVDQWCFYLATNSGVAAMPQAERWSPS